MGHANDLRGCVGHGIARQRDRPGEQDCVEIVHGATGRVRPTRPRLFATAQQTANEYHASGVDHRGQTDSLQLVLGANAHTIGWFIFFRAIFADLLGSP